MGPQVDNNMKLLFQFPTRRSKMCFQTLDKYYALIENLDLAEFHFSCDTDDVDMNNDAVRAKVASYKNCSITFTPNPDRSSSRPCNVVPHQNWDILVVTCDDYIPKVKGFDNIIRETMKKHYPDTDGILHFNDGHQGEAVNTHPILGKKYYDRFGYIVHPDYLMLFGDTELTAVAKKLNRVTYIPDCIIEHQHPDWGYGKKDELYTRKDGYYNHDAAIYHARSSRNFDLK